MIGLTLLKIVVFFYLALYAHDDHEMPGSLPPAPHGGQLGELSDFLEETNKSGSALVEEKNIEIFIEAKLENETLKLFCLSLDSKNKKVFKSLRPQSDIQILELKIEMPRSKKEKILTNFISIEKEYWSANIGQLKDRRFFVVLTLNAQQKKKKVKIQIER